MKLNSTYTEFKKIEKSSDKYISYVYFIKNELNEYIGSCYLRISENENDLFELGNIGYEIDPCHRGLGHGKNAALMMLSEAKSLGLKNAFIVCYEDNISSVKICRSIGANELERFMKNKKTAIRFVKNLEGIKE